MIDTSLYTWFSANVGGGWTVQEGKIDEDKSLPYVWFRRASTIQETLLSGALCDNFTSVFDVEIVGTDIDAVQTECDTLKTGLLNIGPAQVVGTTFCHAIFVEEHSDDYLPRTILNTDTGFHLSFFSLKKRSSGIDTSVF